MAIIAMNEYRLTQENGDSIVTVCPTATEAMSRFDTVLMPITQLVRTAIGIQVSVPDGPGTVTFETQIAGAGAETAGCIATPGSYTVPDGTEVIFEAIPAAGYNFLGWFIGTDTSGTPESVNPIASIEIAAIPAVSQSVIITAAFAPIA